jgi:serine/threonine protein kinase
MSPEILNEQGHDVCVDWWALGILLYELASGKPPFNNKNIDKIAEDIQFEELPMKSYFSKELT